MHHNRAKQELSRAPSLSGTPNGPSRGVYRLASCLGPGNLSYGATQALEIGECR